MLISTIFWKDSRARMSYTNFWYRMVKLTYQSRIQLMFIFLEIS